MPRKPPNSKPPTPNSCPDGESKPSQGRTSSVTLFVGAGLLALGAYLKDDTLTFVGLGLLGAGGVAKVGSKRFSS